MGIKYIYVLVSDEGDFYLEQALISIYSLRFYNRDCFIELVIDKDTASSLVGSRSKIRSYVTSVKEVDVPCEYNKKLKSRYIKTHLRSYVRGTYLFIDCDTVICDKLNLGEDGEVELAAVADMNQSLHLYDQSVVSRCEAAGFNNLEGQPYFNSGVMFVKDTPNTHLFYKEWFENWKSSVAKGVAFDQPALCQTNVQFGKPIQELPGIWNCQFKMGGYPYLRDAKIIHYYSNNGESRLSPQVEMLFSRIKASGVIDEGIMNLVHKPKTLFYSYLDMNQDCLFGYLTSSLLHTYYTSPFFFKVFERMSVIFKGLKSLLSVNHS